MSCGRAPTRRIVHVKQKTPVKGKAKKKAVVHKLVHQPAPKVKAKKKINKLVHKPVKRKTKKQLIHHLKHKVVCQKKTRHAVSTSVNKKKKVAYKPSGRIMKAAHAQKAGRAQKAQTAWRAR